MVKRRDILKLTGMAAVLPALEGKALFRRNPSAGTPPPFDLGMASYTFREFGLKDTLAMTKRLGLGWICLKSVHLPLDSNPDEIRAACSLVQSFGLHLYGGGVIYMENEAQVHQAFTYAGAAGMDVIVGAPAQNLLPLVEDKVEESGIKLAIHNHGPTDRLYPTPESAYELVKDMHPDMGVCVDIGHTQRTGTDPAESVRHCADRLYDVHIKDVSSATAEGSTVEIGRGVIDIPRFLKSLFEVDYRGRVSLEYEKDGKDPLPGAAESIGYIRGVLALL